MKKKKTGSYIINYLIPLAHVVYRVFGTAIKDFSIFQFSRRKTLTGTKTKADNAKPE